MKNIQFLFICILLLSCSNDTNENIDNENPIDSIDEIKNDCPGWRTSDYIIESQEDLDQFAVLFPNCKTFHGNIVFDETKDFNTDALKNIEHIEGSLTFIGIGDGSYDLSGFNNLKSVSLSFEFKNATLVSFPINFQALESVGGDFKIHQNYYLESITGFTNLSLISGKFEIRDNHSLLTLGDFPNLVQVVRGGINFTNNGALSYIGEFGALTSINGAFRIDLDSNNTLTQFSGFNALTSVKGILLGGMTEVNISGFNNIEVIDGFLAFGQIKKVTGFESLKHINGELNLLSTSFENLQILDKLNTIDGDLSITSNHNLTSLAGLDQLTSIGGDFNIYGNDALVNISGSNNINTLNGAINIELNDNLKTISGFNTIETIKELLISNSGAIESLTGFNSLMHIENNLIFNNTNNPEVVINGFNNLQTVGESLNLAWSFNLVELEGFTNLTSVGGSFFFQGSSGLTNLDNFSNLSHVGETFLIQNHTNLENLNGFANLNSMVKDLIIRENPSITDISGVQNINSVLEYVSISNNPMLSQCAITSVCEHLNNGLNHVIENNAPNCNSKDEVISQCD